MTSLAPSAKSFACGLRSVSFTGAVKRLSATKTSAGAAGESIVKATREPLALTLPSCTVRLAVSDEARPEARSSSKTFT